MLEYMQLGCVWKNIVDNFRIDITSDKSIGDAMKLAFGGYKHAVGYRIDAEKGMIFYWSISKNMTPFPFKMDAEGAAHFVLRWLKEADYGQEPDHDGHNGRGWRLYNEDWGHISNEWQAFVAIQPVWAMYGK